MNNEAIRLGWVLAGRELCSMANRGPEGLIASLGLAHHLCLGGYSSMHKARPEGAPFCIRYDPLPQRAGAIDVKD